MPATEHYIPLSRAQVVETIAADLKGEQRTLFLSFTKLLSAWYHYQFHARLEQMKADFQQVQSNSLDKNPVSFAAELDAVAREANFAPISQHDLDQSLAEESVFKLRLFVDFADFSEIVFYSRGTSQQTAMVSSWLGLRKSQIEFTNFEQVLVYIRFKPASYFSDDQKRSFNPGSVVLKLFKNIPKADVEMLFPNTVIRMRLTDKLIIGIPAFFSGVIALTTKVGSSLILLGAILGFWLGFRSEPVSITQAELVVIATGAGAVGAYLWKQFNSFKNRKIRFMKALTENLYFKNMDNDIGVLTNIIDYAEESECKEVILAYGELVIDGPMQASKLIEAIEQRLPTGTQFDIHDAIEKLDELALINISDGILTAVPFRDAIANLDASWDRLFAPQ